MLLNHIANRKVTNLYIDSGLDFGSKIAAILERRLAGYDSIDVDFSEDVVDRSDDVIVGVSGLDEFTARNEKCGFGPGSGCIKTNCPPGFSKIAGAAAAATAGYRRRARVGAYDMAKVGACPPGVACYQSYDSGSPYYVPEFVNGVPNPLSGTPVFPVETPADCISQTFRIVYMGASSDPVAASATVNIDIVPIMPAKIYKMYIPGGNLWNITSFKIANTEYLSGGGVNGAVFGDMNMDAGRLEGTPWFSSDNPIHIIAVNRSTGTLTFNPSFIGIIAND